MKFFNLTAILLVAGLGVSRLNAQQIYTWTDENGVTHLTDQAPPEKARVDDIFKYKEKTPQEEDEIERKIEKLRESNERQDEIDAAQRAAVKARKAEKRAEEAAQKAREETLENEEYVRHLSNRGWKRRKFKKRIERIKTETEASQAQAEAMIRQAEEAAQRAREAAAAVEENSN